LSIFIFSLTMSLATFIKKLLKILILLLGRLQFSD
jgi:hypothetical protein